ncbi:MAG: hypothetical protein ABIO16_14540 [Nocardioides sp.]
MRRGPAGALAAVASSVIAGGVVLATQLGGGAATPSPSPSSPSSPGLAHASAVHAWVACKAEKGKDACEKPVPPGLAKRDGKAPGPASKQGHGNGWGRAHAPGQLKAKHHGDKDKDDADEPDADEPDAD